MNETTVTIDDTVRSAIEVKPTDSDTLPYASSWTAFQYRLYKSHL